MSDWKFFLFLFIGIWIMWFVFVKGEGKEDTSGKFLRTPEKQELPQVYDKPFKEIIKPAIDAID